VKAEADRLRAAKAAAEAAEAAMTVLRPSAGPSVAPPLSLWDKLATGIETKQKLRALFDLRQTSAFGSTDLKLRILTATKLGNDDILQEFRSSGSFNIDPKAAHDQQCDTFLFHGAADRFMPNIQSEGLKMQYAGQAHGIMLGKGVYGAPDPRKSMQYCSGQFGNFMLVCRFVLKANAQYCVNTYYDEFCIFDDHEVVVLWMIKVGY